MLGELSPEKLIETCKGAFERAFGGEIEITWDGATFNIGEIHVNLYLKTVSLPKLSPSYRRDEFIKLVDELSTK